MSDFRLTKEQAAAFHRDGFVIVENLFDAEEMGLLYKISKADQELEKSVWGLADARGGVSRISLRNDLPDDIYSAFVRSPRIVNAMEQLLGGEVYHYHHKMTIKEPFVGGAWEWHQDYGYWYQNGCLSPDMASCVIAVDRTTRENGCLQAIVGSHHLGRIDHGLTGEQQGADMERVSEILKRLPVVHCEQEPGSALFFHSNLLHCSAPNTSPHPRWTLICCYNAARNDPYKAIPGGHPNYHYLEKWPDSRIKEIGRKQWEAMQQAG